MERKPMSKKEKIRAIVLGCLAAFILLVGVYVYPYFKYLLPWNHQTVNRSVTYSATNLEDAIVQSALVVKGKITKIEPNQFDADTGHAYAIVHMQVDEVMLGDTSHSGKTIKFVQLGGKYKSTTYVYDNATQFSVNEDVIVLLNQNLNLTGEPYSKLFLNNEGKYVDRQGKNYSIENFKVLIEDLKEKYNAK